MDETFEPADNIYRFFEATAGKAVKLRVGPDPGGAGSREVNDTCRQ